MLWKVKKINSLNSMIIHSFSETQVNLYVKYIQCIASLSGLFSESKTPFLHYRTAENIFCKSFNAENLSRMDTAYDAKLDSIGIGLKTFHFSSNKSREKIAEFNTHSHDLRKLNNDDLVKNLAYLRNERISFANRTYGIKESIYHCLGRQENSIKIFETEYKKIDINTIKNIKREKSSLFFEDSENEYSYNFSKSTLYRKFYSQPDSIDVPIHIIKDPYDLILKLLDNYTEKQARLENVILPLYATRNTREKKVQEKSALNHWNAGGRKRNFGEVYIPIPRKIYQFYPNFFPTLDSTFNLILPDKNELSCKVCQEGGKALMSNPNHALSEWLLRKVLLLKEGELLTYEHLRKIGIDSVKITKINEKNFKIDFAKIGSYENFILNPSGWALF